MNSLNFFNIGFNNQVNKEFDSILLTTHEIQSINIKLLSENYYKKTYYQILLVLNVCYGEMGLYKKKTQLDFPIPYIENIENKFDHKIIQDVFELVDTKNKLTLSIEKKKNIFGSIKQSLKLSNKLWTIHRINNSFSNELKIEDNQYKKLNKLSVLNDLKEYNNTLKHSLSFYHFIHLLFDEKFKQSDGQKLINLLRNQEGLLSVITVFSQEREQAILIPLLKEINKDLSVEKLHENLKNLYQISYDWGKSDMYPPNDLTEVLATLGKAIKQLENKDSFLYQSINRIIFKEELREKLNQETPNSIKSKRNKI